mgnify:FL=1
MGQFGIGVNNVTSDVIGGLTEEALWVLHFLLAEVFDEDIN